MVTFYFYCRDLAPMVSYLSRTDCEGPGIESDCCRWQMKRRTKWRFKGTKCKFQPYYGKKRTAECDSFLYISYLFAEGFEERKQFIKKICECFQKALHDHIQLINKHNLNAALIDSVSLFNNKIEIVKLP